MTLESNARNAAVNAITALLNSGTLEFQTSADNEVATVTFASTAFGSAVAGVATANTITDDTNATGGTIAKAVAKKSDSTPVFTLTVGTVGSGEDVELTSLVIGAGDTVSITSMALTQPAS